MTSTKDAVYTKIAKSENFPSLPEVLVKLLDACEDENRSFSEIADIISKDPTLSFKVLQLVNSAYYGFHRTFTSIEQAVIYLGADSVKNIAVTTSVYQVFDNKRLRNVKQFNLKLFWYHSLLCATMAKRVAHKTHYSNYEEAYLSGLLHDIGRLLLVATFPREHEAILAETVDTANMIWAEEQLIGVTHCETGGWLVQQWQLASLMTEAIRRHHSTVEEVAGSFPLVKIVFFSNMLSHGSDEETYEAGSALLGLNESDVDDIVGGAAEEVGTVADSLGIKIERGSLESKQGKSGFQKSPEGKESEGAEQSSDTPPEKGLENKNKSSAHGALKGRVKNVALLTTILENLAQADQRNSILEIFERGVNVLLNLSKVLLFLPDEQNLLLKGTTSSNNHYHQVSRDLTLPLHRSSSKIVKSYDNGTITSFFQSSPDISPADSQVLKVLGSSGVLLVPVKTDSKTLGVALLGLQETGQDVSTEDHRLLKAMTRQIGHFLYLEKLKSKQAAEVQAERLAAISLTAKKFAHEVNNPLGIIKNYLSSLKIKLDERADILTDISVINDEISRISSLVNKLDLFSQPVSGIIEEIDLNKTISETIQFLERSLGDKKDVSITFRPSADLPYITTSRDGIKQIILNLVKNAMEAFSAGGKIQLTTRRVIADGGGGEEPGEVEIIVRDNGPGLPEHVKSNLFKPFVTTKDSEHSGLGLSIVYKAVRSLGGHISCVSKSNIGTTFSICLPLEKDQSNREEP